MKEQKYHTQGARTTSEQNKPLPKPRKVIKDTKQGSNGNCKSPD